ncbi:unnamed protein product [Knipowitschia caucasica]
MSWFNASHLSTFAKQALTTAQKSIDRVLDIKEEEQWGDSAVMPYNDVTLPEKLSLSGGWGLTQWEAPPEEQPSAPALSSEAITTPVTRTVVDESENFFSAFLPPGDVPSVTKSHVVSVPPSKSQTRLQETDETDSEDGNTVNLQMPAENDIESSEVPESRPAEPTSPVHCPDTILLQPVSPVSLCPALEPSNSDNDETKTCEIEVDIDLSVVAKSEEPPTEDTENAEEPPKPTTIPSDSNDSAPSDPSPLTKESDQKETKPEDRQSDTPSPPVSAFSSGTSTTSDIEVLDHESVLSESSASSRQETADGKAGLHLMQDAFERIDSFSMQSLDSRSVSEVNSDDDVPGSRTLASVTAAPLTAVEASESLKEEDKGRKAEDEDEEEDFGNTLKEQTVDEMEESGRSATPVNSDQLEDLLVHESESNSTLVDLYTPEEDSSGPITVEMKSASTFEILELQKVVHELTTRLETRESQLLTVSKDKARLEEECDNLKDEVLGLKEESSTVQSLKDEFTQRIADTERKAQLACKERDIAKKEIKGLREELSTRLNSVNTMEIIKEKEEQIRGLLEEGEKLSKQQLQHSNIIKKLRAKEKESDSRILKHEKKMKELEDELGLLQQVLDGKEEVEKQHRENIKKLNAVVEKQEREMSKLQADSEELQETSRSLQSALDNSYRELAELHKANASRASEAEEVALSREIWAKEQLSVSLEKAQEEARAQQEALADQVADLRLALQRAEQQQARKEDYLREEISELQQRLQEAESRNQELSQSVTSATRPLLRQIENLQASLGGQTASWEKLEKSISDRLVEAQAQLAVAVEKERSASDELLNIRSQMVSLESQNSLLRQEKARVLAQLEAEKNKKEKLEDEGSRHLVELENLRGEHSRILEETKKEKLLLTNQLEMERMKVEQEKKKCYLAQESLREKERLQAPPSSTPSLSRSSSISAVDHAGLHATLLSQEESVDGSGGNMSLSLSGSNLYEAARLSGGSSVIENLQSQLKLRDGEITQLQMEISGLERSRSVMAEELVRLTNQNDETEEKVKEIPQLRLLLKDLEQRHNTILQMYGEKAEEAQELRLDLEDVKNMYKTQINELLRNQK